MAAPEGDEKLEKSSQGLSRDEEIDYEEQEEIWAMQNMFDPDGYYGPPLVTGTPSPVSVFNDSDDDMTDEQWRIYSDAVDQTDGFDVPYIRDLDVYPQIVPMDISGKNKAKFCEQFCQLAIDKYNEKFKEIEGELEFVEVLKAMTKASRGTMYYLTFNAKNFAKGSQIITYQAIVLKGIEETEVLSFRVKPDQEGGELEFVEVLKAMTKASRGTMYYLTFNAKNFAKGSQIITYQAIVLKGIEETEVLSFRVKPDQEGVEVTTKKWLWKNRCCCSGIKA